MVIVISLFPYRDITKFSFRASTIYIYVWGGICPSFSSFSFEIFLEKQKDHKFYTIFLISQKT